MKIKAGGIDILQKSSAVYQNYFRPEDFNKTEDKFYKSNKNQLNQI